MGVECRDLPGLMFPPLILCSIKPQCQDLRNKKQKRNPREYAEQENREKAQKGKVYNALRGGTS